MIRLCGTGWLLLSEQRANRYMDRLLARAGKETEEEKLDVELLVRKFYCVDEADRRANLFSTVVWRRPSL